MTGSDPRYIARRAERARVQLRLTVPLRDRLLREARDAGVSLNVYVESALCVYLDFLQDSARPDGRRPPNTSQEADKP
jgi:hypothetical protein